MRDFGVVHSRQFTGGIFPRIVLAMKCAVSRIEDALTG
jgi:hypothetical protein